jgi:hypothetical protein
MMRTLLRTATLIAAVPLALAAQTTTHTTSASFFAATQAGSFTNTFSTGDGLFAGPLTFTQGAFSYRVSAAGGSTPLYITDTSSPTGTWIGNAYSNQALTFTFLSGNVTAIGGNFFLTNSVDAFVSAAVTITLSNGTAVTFTPSAITDFRGFTTSGAAITSLVLSAPGLSRFNSVDNFTVGIAAPTSVVPEPATTLLFAGGLVMLGALSHRRRRSQN